MSELLDTHITHTSNTSQVSKDSVALERRCSFRGTFYLERRCSFKKTFFWRHFGFRKTFVQRLVGARAPRRGSHTSNTTQVPIPKEVLALERRLSKRRCSKCFEKDVVAFERRSLGDVSSFKKTFVGRVSSSVGVKAPRRVCHIHL